MANSSQGKIAGLLLIAQGVGLIIFGGSKRVNGFYIEIFGIKFGNGESEPFGKIERVFWGLVCIIGGVLLYRASS
jgi:hypothetical protein